MTAGHGLWEARGTWQGHVPDCCGNANFSLLWNVSSEGCCSGFADVLGGNLGQNSGKILRNFCPTVVFSYEFAGCSSNFNPPSRVAQKGSHTLGEDVGLVRQNDVIAGLHG